MLIAITGLADPKNITRQRNWDGPFCNCLPGRLTSVIWPLHFFAKASVIISALRRSSTTILRRRRFSSFNSFMRVIMDTSMPPNLARYLKKTSPRKPVIPYKPQALPEHRPVKRLHNQAIGKSRLLQISSITKFYLNRPLYCGGEYKWVSMIFTKFNQRNAVIKSIQKT